MSRLHSFISASRNINQQMKISCGFRMGNDANRKNDPDCSNFCIQASGKLHVSTLCAVIISTHKMVEKAGSLMSREWRSFRYLRCLEGKASLVHESGLLLVVTFLFMSCKFLLFRYLCFPFCLYMPHEKEIQAIKCSRGKLMFEKEFFQQIEVFPRMKRHASFHNVECNIRPGKGLSAIETVWE